MNCLQNRAARQGGRRPPSRRALKSQSSQSDDTLAAFTSDITATPSSTQQQPSDKRLFDSDPLSLGGAGLKPDVTDDLFAASSTVLSPARASTTATKKSKKPVPRPATKKEPADITKDILFGNDDLLAESPPREAATVVDEKRVTEIEKQIQKEMQEDDDLFGTKVLSKKPTTTISDELFGSPIHTQSTAPSTATTSVLNKDSTHTPPVLKVCNQ